MRGISALAGIGQLARRTVNRLGRARECNICRQTFHRFEPYRGGWASVPPFLREARTVGSDVVQFGCPGCGSNDRERHLYLYFDALRFWERFPGRRVLHVAPEPHLSERIATLGPAEYVRGDLFPASPNLRRVDITALDFPTAHFDIILCNHVLEHVPDDARAMAELFRVLVPGGTAILQTPFSPVFARTFCDPALDTDELRLQFYGQEDHVRLYGRDLFDRLRAVGFHLDVVRHADRFGPSDAVRFGVNAREDLIRVVKPATGGVP